MHIIDKKKPHKWCAGSYLSSYRSFLLNYSSKSKTKLIYPILIYPIPVGSKFRVQSNILQNVHIRLTDSCSNTIFTFIVESIPEIALIQWNHLLLIHYTDIYTYNGSIHNQRISSKKLEQSHYIMYGSKKKQFHMMHSTHSKQIFVQAFVPANRSFLLAKN